jgi:excisionase family DNA binding protein
MKARQKESLEDNMNADTRNEQGAPIFVRLSEAARLLSMSRASAYQALRKGVIPGVRIDGKWRVPLAALRKMAVEAATVVEPQDDSDDKSAA